MTVKKLIEKLQKMPQDADVFMYQCYNGNYMRIDGVKFEVTKDPYSNTGDIFRKDDGSPDEFVQLD